MNISLNPSKYDSPFVYVKNSQKLYNSNNNPDLIFFKLLKPDGLTKATSLSIVESNQGKHLLSRRTLNVLGQWTIEPEKEELEEKEEEMPDNHGELMKGGGMCPVLHGEDGSESMGECPSDCKGM